MGLLKSDKADCLKGGQEEEVMEVWKYVTAGRRSIHAGLVK